MEKKKVAKINAHGSLAVLALGHIGLRKWRAVVEAEKENNSKNQQKDGEKADK